MPLWIGWTCRKTSWLVRQNWPPVIVDETDTYCFVGPVPDFSKNLQLTQLYLHENALSGTLVMRSSDRRWNRYLLFCIGPVPDFSKNLQLMHFYLYKNALSGTLIMRSTDHIHDICLQVPFLILAPTLLFSTFCSTIINYQVRWNWRPPIKVDQFTFVKERSPISPSAKP